AFFGSSVALSANGNTGLVGGTNDSSGAGAAWVFTRSNGIWTQQGAKLTGGGQAGLADFGTSVALSADGNTALVGGPWDAPGQSGGAGAAWVFTRSGGTWTQQGAKLTATDESGLGKLGSGAALSADGDTALLGGPADGQGAGAAW